MQDRKYHFATQRKIITANGQPIGGCACETARSCAAWSFLNGRRAEAGQRCAAPRRNVELREARLRQRPPCGTGPCRSESSVRPRSGAMPRSGGLGAGVTTLSATASFTRSRVSGRRAQALQTRPGQRVRSGQFRAGAGGPPPQHQVHQLAEGVDRGPAELIDPRRGRPRHRAPRSPLGDIADIDRLEARRAAAEQRQPRQQPRHRGEGEEETVPRAEHDAGCSTSPPERRRARASSPGPGGHRRNRNWVGADGRHVDEALHARGRGDARQRAAPLAWTSVKRSRRVYTSRLTR